MKAKTISWVIFFVLGIGALIPYALIKFGMASTLRMVKREIDSDLQAANVNERCSQIGTLDSFALENDPDIWITSPKRMYWKTLILHDSTAIRTESSLIFVYVSRHYQALLREKGIVQGMGEWHLRGLLLVLAFEENLDRRDLVKLACQLEAKTTIKMKKSR
jgi:hypothetical protein